jgi:GNAT superfamily N-acetyltransferase
MAEISTDKKRLDVDLVHRFLTAESYWATDVPRDIVEASIEHSLCFGAYDGGAQVGFARVITDYATFGYIADVFVVASHRGSGVGREIMAAIRAHPALQRLRRWHLVTRDAHRLYEQFGFQPLATPERHMEIAIPNAYRDHD